MVLPLFPDAENPRLIRAVGLHVCTSPDALASATSGSATLGELQRRWQKGETTRQGKRGGNKPQDTGEQGRCWRAKMEQERRRYSGRLGQPGQPASRIRRPVGHERSAVMIGRTAASRDMPKMPRRHTGPINSFGGRIPGSRIMAMEVKSIASLVARFGEAS